MKSTQELREELYQLINNIQDEENLQLLRRMILQNFVDNDDEEEEQEGLTEAQQAQLQQTAQDLQPGENIS